MSEGCIKKKDSFCYVCAKYFTKHQRRHFRGHKIDLYKMYFGMEPQNLGKPFAPRFICTTCSTSFYTWKNHNRHFTFGRPAIWKPIGSDHSNCYFCLTKTDGINKQTKKSLDYPSVRSHLEAPLLHSINVPFPQPYAVQIELQKADDVNASNNLTTRPSSDNSLLDLLLKSCPNNDEIESRNFRSLNNFDDFDSLKDFDAIMKSNGPTISSMNLTNNLTSLNSLLNLTKPKPKSTIEIFDFNGALDLTMKSSRNK